jgi:23S rRNA G2069 N7-methylase RlmK/C1962 C5-methylase RlmI
MQIIHADSDWLVVEKPPGISTHGAWAGDLGVQEWLELHHQTKCYVVSRLDKETSGILLFAKTKQASAHAETIHQTGVAVKRYQLVATPRKVIPGNSWVVDSPIDGKPARTEFRLVEEFSSKSVLLEATIKAGRMHQIRRHAAASGLPILGDVEYGGLPFDRLCLHCCEVDWPGIPPLRSPLPKSFLSLRSSKEQAPEDHTVKFAVALDRRMGSLGGISNSLRIVHRKELGADFAIDKFQDYFVAWLYDANAKPALIAVLDECIRFLGLKGGAIKSLWTNPHKRGALCNSEWMGEAEPWDTNVLEHGLLYGVTLNAADQTGFFLDQRDNRRRLFLTANGKDIANLFSYTCSFSIAAAAGQCNEVVSVDISKTALGTGIKNLQLNELDKTKRAKIVQEDVRDWLKKQIKRGRQFDTVICDPPTFASGGNASASFKLENEWPLLARDIAKILRGGGEALFCTNSRTMNTQNATDTLSHHFNNVTRYRTPLDFPEAVDPVHNRFFWCKK